MTGEDIRSWIRGLPALTGKPPQAPSTFPDRPNDLFVSWLREAVTAGVREPHVCALSTVDDSGVPDTRYLLLKDVTGAGFWFSGSADSMKGIELSKKPRRASAEIPAMCPRTGVHGAWFPTRSSSGKRTKDVVTSGGNIAALKTAGTSRKSCGPDSSCYVALISGDTRLTTMDCPPSFA